MEVKDNETVDLRSLFISYLSHWLFIRPPLKLLLKSWCKMIKILFLPEVSDWVKLRD